MSEHLLPKELAELRAQYVRRKYPENRRPHRLGASGRARVVRLYISGLSQAEIARRLDIRPQTVAYHLRAALEAAG